MSARHHHLLAYAITGLISGTICWAGSLFLPEIPALQQYYPPVVLGIFLYINGKYTARLKTGNDIVTLMVLIIASILGWRAAVEIGHPLGEPLPFVSAGALGGLITAAGWLLAWNLRNRIIKSVIILILAGALGGGIFQVLDTFLDMSGDLWIWILFSVWQSLFFTGIGIILKR